MFSDCGVFLIAFVRSLLSSSAWRSRVCFPVLFVIGGWMYTEGRKEEVGDEEDEVKGEAGENGSKIVGWNSDTASFHRPLKELFSCKHNDLIFLSSYEYSG